MRHVEMFLASKWYGKHATGYVVLVDGHCYFHGPKAEAKAFLQYCYSLGLVSLSVSRSLQDFG